MAAENDFEKRYFDQMEGNFNEIKGGIREVKDETKSITGHVSKINKRLIKVENRVFPPAQQETVSQLPPLWRDPQVIKLLTFITVALIILLIIYAGIRGIELPKGIF